MRRRESIAAAERVNGGVYTVRVDDVLGVPHGPRALQGDDRMGQCRVKLAAAMQEQDTHVVRSRLAAPIARRHRPRIVERHSRGVEPPRAEEHLGPPGLGAPEQVDVGGSRE